MNKELKKHLEASYTKAFEVCAQTGHKIGDLDAIFNSIVMGTFAELIVRESAKVSEDDITDGDACCTNTAYRIARHIRKHFGVKA